MRINTVWFAAGSSVDTTEEEEGEYKNKLLEAQTYPTRFRSVGAYFLRHRFSRVTRRARVEISWSERELKKKKRGTLRASHQKLFPCVSSYLPSKYFSVCSTMRSLVVFLFVFRFSRTIQFRERVPRTRIGPIDTPFFVLEITYCYYYFFIAVWWRAKHTGRYISRIWVIVYIWWVTTRRTTHETHIALIYERMILIRRAT